MTSKAKTPASGRARSRMSPALPIGLAVRSAAIDCEGAAPRRVLLAWEDERGRIHKRFWPERDRVAEEGFQTTIGRLPLGSTKDATPRA